MTWLALRLLRPYLMVAGLIAAAATGYLLSAAGVIQRHLDEAGLPDCRDPNLCWPGGDAMQAIFGIQLVAAFVPPLIGLVLGVALFAREREEDTAAFALTQSTPRGRWVLIKLGWALTAGMAGTAVVAVTHRLLTAPYTVIANDNYELIELLHLNHPGYMTAQTAALIAIAALAGLRTGRTLSTLVLTAAAWPVTLISTFIGVNLLAAPIEALTGDAPPAGGGSFADDYTLADTFGWAGTVVLALGVLGLVLLSRGFGARAIR
jgi:ABC-type transport system involved in multi-copper enzyme maturation permease subunit